MFEKNYAAGWIMRVRKKKENVQSRGATGQPVEKR
jgi:hypothetical protein